MQEEFKDILFDIYLDDFYCLSSYHDGLAVCDWVPEDTQEDKES